MIPDVEVAAVRCTGEVWLAKHEAVLRTYPHLREVRLTKPWPQVDRVTDGPHVVGYRFPGRGMVHQASPTVEMLAAEWPGVTFTLLLEETPR